MRRLFSSLKLDAEYYRGDNRGTRGEIVVSEAIRLAKNLDMLTVAEGIEERKQIRNYPTGINKESSMNASQLCPNFIKSRSGMRERNKDL